MQVTDQTSRYEGSILGTDIEIEMKRPLASPLFPRLEKQADLLENGNVSVINL